MMALHLEWYGNSSIQDNMKQTVASVISFDNIFVNSTKVVVWDFGQSTNTLYYRLKCNIEIITLSKLT
jgi:hypothetical protein